MLGSNVFAAESVHPDFDDSRFYSCVVEAYNNKTGSSKDYTTDILTDAELGQITILDCSKGPLAAEADKISDVTGLGKMTNLANLNLEGNQIESIDLSKNTELTYLNVYKNHLNSLDISHNTKLKEIHAKTYLGETNDITTLDITNNPGIEHLYMDDGILLDSNIKAVQEGDRYKIDLSSLKFLWNDYDVSPWAQGELEGKILSIEKQDIEGPVFLGFAKTAAYGINIRVDKPESPSPKEKEEKEEKEDPVPIPNTNDKKNPNTSSFNALPIAIIASLAVAILGVCGKKVLDRH